jgi:hypothetical protein
VFITKGPYCATGSPIGRPWSSRNSAGAAPFTISTASVARSSIAERAGTGLPAIVAPSPAKK